MGIAANLFFNTTSPQETLDWRIRPSDEQYDKQKERWGILRDYLIDDLRTKSNYPTSSWLQGSYKFGTQVRPAKKEQEFDIDLGIYFQWTGAPEDGDWAPSELKEMVQTSLVSYLDDDENDAEGVSEPKERCNRIHFADNFHIDVPSYHLEPTEDERSLATESDDWETSDPKAIHRWWVDSFDDNTRPRVRRLVRYTKMWAALKFSDTQRPSSILLTVLVAEAFLSIDTSTHNGDDEFFCVVISSIIERLETSYSVPNPAYPDEDLNRLSDDDNNNFVENLEELISICDRALASASIAASAEIWSEAFKYFFPIPEEIDLFTKSENALVPIEFDPIINIMATPKGQTAKSFQGQNKLGPIPKNCTIRFSLANAYQLPQGAIITWTVRNEGEEAENENDLGHINGIGLSTEETSAYKGRHHMDVAVKLNGTLIGFRRVPVTITGLGLPQRNPRRPDYVKFRRKR